MKIFKNKGGIMLMAIIGVAIIVVAILFFHHPQNAQAPTGNDIVYYYGKNCPHCHDVELFLASNNIDQKIKFIKKEVQFNPENAKELFIRDDECGITGNEKGSFPLVYNQGKCYLGTPEVINFFKQKAGI
jgi:hypothetical protein